MFCLFWYFTSGFSVSSQLFASQLRVSNSAYKQINNSIVLVHSWKELEQQRKLGTIGPTKGQRRFERDGEGWRDFKDRHWDKIRRYSRKKLPEEPREKGAYYYYNYKYGFITDNCEFIREPVRFCWFESNGKRECQWRMKWQYACY